MMKELAMEELKLLEAQHPTRFQFLKLQLKEFIHLLDQQEDEQSFKRNHYNHNHHSVLTQESTTRKTVKMTRKTKRERKDEKTNKVYTRGRGRRRNKKGTNDAIQKAKACLLKIQILKSFFCSSNH